MIAVVNANLLAFGPISTTLKSSLYIETDDGWETSVNVDIPLSGSAATVNAAVKQAAADAVKEQHGVTLDPATEILLVGGAS